MSSTDSTSFTATTENAAKRLDVVITEHFTNLSRARVQSAIESGMVQINQTVVIKPSHQVTEGDVVTVRNSHTSTALTPIAREIEVLLEDPDLLVINKPAGIVVHPTTPEHTDSLVQVVLAHYPDIAQALYEPDNPISHQRPGIVHRLDKDSSGAILIARNRPILLALLQQFQQHTVTKEYLALAWGSIPQKQTISANLIRRGTVKVNRMHAVEGSQGRTAITHIVPIGHHEVQSGEYTSLSCTIETGRTHQIRAHLRHIGHPLLGDTIYGTTKSQELSTKLGIHRQMLHARTLAFTHPTTGERITVNAPVPDDLNKLL